MTVGLQLPSCLLLVCNGSCLVLQRGTPQRLSALMSDMGTPLFRLGLDKGTGVELPQVVEHRERIKKQHTVCSVAVSIIPWLRRTSLYKGLCFGVNGTERQQHRTSLPRPRSSSLSSTHLSLLSLLLLLPSCTNFSYLRLSNLSNLDLEYITDPILSPIGLRTREILGFVYRDSLTFSSVLLSRPCHHSPVCDPLGRLRC